MTVDQQLAVAAILVSLLVACAPAVHRRYFKRPHGIDIGFGNAVLVPVASPNEARNRKVALVIYPMKVVNVGPVAATLKRMELRYRFRRRVFHAPVADLALGVVEGERAIGISNFADNIIVAWTNPSEKLLGKTLLAPGQVDEAHAAFFLDRVPANRLREVKSMSIIIHDYVGGRSVHQMRTPAAMYELDEKRFTLIDSPIAKAPNGDICWPGVELTAKPFNPG